MKKLWVFLPIAMAAVALLLASCSGPILSLSDSEIAFSSNGFVKTTVTYTYHSGSTDELLTFSTDGTYEDVGMNWDGPSSSWKQVWGDKGTYSYVPDTRMLTVNFTQTWSGGVTGSYVPLNSSSTGFFETDAYLAVFGSDNFYQTVLTGSNGAYTSTEKVTYWGGASSNSVVTLTIASDFSTMTSTSESEHYNAGGTATSGSKSAWVYTADRIFPSSVTTLDNAKGKVVTFSWLKAVNTPYTWVSGTAFTAGTATTSNSAGSTTLTFASDASYLAMIPFSQTRHLASK